MTKSFRWTLLAGLLLYAAYTPRFYVGFFNDDATYIIGAISLGQGHYSLLSRPGTPPINKFGVGYPLFLAPFAKVFSPHWNWLRWTSIALTMGSLALFGTLAALFLTPAAAALTLFLFAMNPTMALYSGTVLSDPCFLFVVLLTFFFLNRTLENSRAHGILLGLVLGWAWLIRPVGALLFLAVGLTLILAKRGRALFFASAISLTLWNIQNLRNLRLTQTSNAYFSFWRTSLPYLADLHHLSDNAVRVLHTFLVYSLLGIQFPYGPWTIALSLLLMSLLTGVMAIGLSDILRSKSLKSLLAFGMGLFCCSYLVLQILWTAISQRYALPLLPFLLLFAARGLQSKTFQRKRISWLMATLLAMLLTSYAFRHAQDLSLAWGEKPIEERYPAHALEWIKRATAPSAIFIGKESLVYLETGRRGVGLPNRLDPDEIRMQLLEQGVTHVLFQPTHVLEVHGNQSGNEGQIWRQTFFWLTQWPEAYRPVFSDVNEQTAIYQAIIDPRFQEAFAHAETARSLFRQHSTDAGFREIRKSIELDPRLASSWNTFGEALLFMEHDIRNAGIKFQQALSIRRSYPEALLNLARVRRLQGETSEAAALTQESKTTALQLGRPDWAEFIDEH